jgi:hypothetical protein
MGEAGWRGARELVTEADYLRAAEQVVNVIKKAGFDPREALNLLCMIIGTLVATQAETEDIEQVLAETSQDIADIASGRFGPGDLQ